MKTLDNDLKENTNWEKLLKSSEQTYKKESNFDLWENYIKIKKNHNSNVYRKVQFSVLQFIRSLTKRSKIKF